MSRPIRIGVLEADKDATSCFRNPMCTRPGAEIEIIQMVFRIIGEQYELIDVANLYNVSNDLGELIVERVEGGMERILSSNGISSRTTLAQQGVGIGWESKRKWSGMMGLLTNDLIDMSGISMRITRERSRDVLFAYPTRFFQSIFIIATPSGSQLKSFIVSGFSDTVWCILIGVILICFLMQIIHILVRRCILQRGESINGRCLVVIFLLAMTKTFVAPRRAPLISQGIYGAVFILSLFFIMQVYQSMMFSVLASPIHVSLPFMNSNGALDAVESGSLYFSAYERQALLCSTSSMCNRLKQVISVHPVVRRTAEWQIADDLKHGGIYQATIDGEFVKADVSWLEERRKDQIAIRDGNGPKYYGAFAFNMKRKKLMKRFNAGLQLLYPSISMITTGHGYHTKKVPMDMFTLSGFFPLSLSYLREAFVYFLFAQLVAAVVFAIEVLLHLLLAHRCSSSSRRFHPSIVITSSTPPSSRRPSTTNPLLQLMASIQFKPARRESYVP